MLKDFDVQVFIRKPTRQFPWNVKAYFSGTNTKKYHQFVVLWISPVSGKGYTSTGDAQE